MKYYAVTKGRLSDYHIITITADKEKAELIARLHAEERYYGFDTNVEEFEDSVEVLLPLYEVTYWDNEIKDIDRIREDDFHAPQWFMTEWQKEYYKENPKVNEIYVYSNGMIELYVRAKDEDCAKKIAYDLIAEYIAKNSGVS